MKEPNEAVSRQLDLRVRSSGKQSEMEMGNDLPLGGIWMAIGVDSIRGRGWELGSPTLKGRQREGSP